MARTNAVAIYTDEQMQVKDLLAERYDALIENIQTEAISMQIKNQNLSGDPRAGSVEVSRFANAEAKAYGTARAAGAGQKLINSGKVTVNINVDREIVTEIERKDIRFKGLADIVAQRTRNHAQVMAVDLDNAFFTEAENAATAVDVTGLTKASEKVDAVIEKITNQRTERACNCCTAQGRRKPVCMDDCQRQYRPPCHRTHGRNDGQPHSHY